MGWAGSVPARGAVLGVGRETASGENGNYALVGAVSHRTMVRWDCAGAVLVQPCAVLPCGRCCGAAGWKACRPIFCKFRWFRAKWQECGGFFCSECFLFVLLPRSFQHKGCTDGRSALRSYPQNLLRIMPAKEWMKETPGPAGRCPGSAGGRLAARACDARAAVASP